MGMIEGPDNTYRFKCDFQDHNFKTNDAYEYEDHKRRNDLHHYEILTNIPCFYCGEMINAGVEEQVEYRHMINGTATHKACRKKMAADLNLED